jgi:hypothetical protein
MSVLSQEPERFARHFDFAMKTAQKQDATFMPGLRQSS